MTSRRVKMENIGEVHIFKRRQSRNIRLSIAHDSTIRLSLPLWVSYEVGLEFVKQRMEWITKNRPINTPISPNCQIGKTHRLVFLNDQGSSAPLIKRSGNLIVISLPKTMQYGHPAAQQAAERGAIDALYNEALRLLPPRLDSLAQKHGFSYKSISVKRLKTRWGSCNQEQEITLNCFLVQLPWRLIDYVILHELLHTKVLTHGPMFWSEMRKYVKDLETIRKVMRKQRPHLTTSNYLALCHNINNAKQRTNNPNTY